MYKLNCQYDEIYWITTLWEEKYGIFFLISIFNANSRLKFQFQCATFVSGNSLASIRTTILYKKIENYTLKITVKCPSGHWENT